jgi:hypothetical protein
MAEESKLSKAEIQELKSLIRLLKEEISDIEFESLIKSGPAAKKLLTELRAENGSFRDSISDARESFKRLEDEIKGTQSGVKTLSSIYSKITRLTEDIQRYQKDILNYNEKDISKLTERLNIQQEDLKNTDRILKAEEKDLKNAELTKKALQDQLLIQYDLRKAELQRQGIDIKNNKELEELEKQYTKIDKDLESIGKKIKENRDGQKEIEGILKDQDGNYNLLKAAVADLNSKLEQQNKLLGLGGAIISSLDTALNNLGFGRLAGALGIGEAKTEMDEFSKKILKDRENQLVLEKEINKAIDDRTGEPLSPEVLAEKQNQLDALKGQNAQYDGINGKLAVLKKGISSMGASLVKNLTDPVALTVGFVTQLIGALKTSDEATGKLAKQFGTSYKEASNMRQELNSIANSSFNVNISTKDLQESLMAVNQALGTNGKLNEADLITMSELTKQAGYTHDELMGIEKLSLAQGKSLNDNVKLTLGSAKAHAATRGLMINEREVLKEVNKMSASLKLSLGGSVDRMAEAVVKTKALGLSIEQAEKMASGLLEFESSISSELEAEVLTGKSLNFEKARLLALNNDVAGAAEEIVKQVEKAGDFTKMNRIQQEAVAKAAGMTRDELAQSIIDKKALAKLDVEGAKTAKEAYEKLKQQGLSEQQIREKLGDDELAQQLESQSLQEKFNATVEKLKEIFISLSGPILDIANALTPVFKVIGGIASGIGAIVNFLNKWTFGTLPLLIGGFLTLKLLSGGIGTALLKGLVYPFKAAKEGLSSLSGGFKSMLSSIKEKGIGGTLKDAVKSVKTNLKNKLSDKPKADDLADKAKDKGDKASDSTKGGDNAKGFADRMKNIAKGIKAFGDAKVILGALIGLPAAAVGLIAMLPGVLGAKAIETLDGKKLKSSLEGLAKGIEAMASGKVAAGAGALILASIGLTAMLPGVLGALAIQSIDGKAVKKALEGLADGLEAMAKGKVLLGAGALAVVSVALVAALPGMLAAAALGAIGPLVEKGLTSFAKGIERLGTGKVFLGAAALAALGLALIPAAYALKQFSEVSWSDLGKAGVALLGLGIAGAAFGSFVPLMLAGAVAIAALGASLIPFGIALRIIAPALEKFTPIIEAFGNVISKTFSGIAEVITSAFTGLSDLFKTLNEVDPIKLFAIGPALASIGAGLAVLGGGSLAGGILGSIGKLFGGGVVKKLNELSSIDSSKILTLAEAINKLSESIANLNNVTANVGDVSPIITTVDKVVELHDSLNKTSLEKVVDKVSEGVSSLFSKAFEFVSSVSSTDKTIANAESTTSASSLSSATSSKSLVDKTNIEAKEVILNVSDKAITNLTTDKTKELNKNKESDKTKELNITGLKEELLTNQKTNQLVSTSIDNLKVANLIVEKQTEGKTDSTKGAIAGATIGSFLGPLGALAGGLIGEMFSGTNEEEIVPINNEIQPLDQTISTLNNANNTNASSLVNNNQNITSNENVVKILQEAVNVLKAIQAKDTSVQLAIDGDVIARKITPSVNREQVKTYSNIS